jgi:hypothetical protein
MNKAKSKIVKIKKKLISPNVFVLVFTAIIGLGIKLFGLEIGFSTGFLLPIILLILVPKMGFFYCYFTSKISQTRKIVA